ncbi:Heme oxygenase [Handroanthus impetiginosus]|uniref:Heme oxygenase n=1 Tax=Handroanthus impetiginosus TaxID=429701 RepID=A0A2G9I6I9_9LAMI|nr:Heme oxygenase [Handroanthus impetiginosus]
MAYCSCPATTLSPSASLNYLKNSTPQFFNKFHSAPKLFTKSNNCRKISANARLFRNPFLLQCTKFSTPTFVSETERAHETEEDYKSAEEYSEGEEGPAPMGGHGQTAPPLRRQRRRYRKQYPGEEKGICEEMRFVAMKLRNSKNNQSENNSGDNNDSDEENTDNGSEKEGNSEEKNDDGNGGTWQPSMEGFLKYLVDSELVFRTVERIVDESTDVSYVYFRKTGLERSDCISTDLKWLREQGNVIPEPSNPGVTYSQYLEELAEKSPPLFLCHFYNIYFSHIAGGQVIAKQVSKKLLGGRELEFYKWDGDAEELLRGVREKLNALGEHWSRDEKNKCLREATKAFRSLGQIVRLIILL